MSARVAAEPVFAIVYQESLTLSRKNLDVTARWFVLFLLAFGAFGSRLPLAKGQTLIDSESSSRAAVLSTSAAQTQREFSYARPTEKTKVRNYIFDAYGPYPIAAAGLAAGIDFIDHAPPEWRQGVKGYSRRLGSDAGGIAITATTRYALAEAFHEDTLYYRCECKGVFRRLGHAVISTLIARRGDDGHRVFSVPDLVAPYAGTMTAVYGWYPGRYNAMDGFRMGNYSLLGYAGANIALEFLYSGPHSWISRMHLNNSHGAPSP